MHSSTNEGASTSASATSTPTHHKQTTESANEVLRRVEQTEPDTGPENNSTRLEGHEQRLKDAVVRNRQLSEPVNVMERLFEQLERLMVIAYNAKGGDVQANGHSFDILPDEYVAWLNTQDRLSVSCERLAFGGTQYTGSMRIKTSPDPTTPGEGYFFFDDHTITDQELHGKARIGSVVEISDFMGSDGQKKTVIAMVSQPLDADRSNRISIGFYMDAWKVVQHLATREQVVHQAGTGKKPESREKLKFIRLAPDAERRVYARRNLATFCGSPVSEELKAAYRARGFRLPNEQSEFADPREAHQAFESLLQTRANELTDAAQWDGKFAGLELTPSQRDVVMWSHSTSITLVVGPPGAGKTTTTAATIEQFIRTLRLAGYREDEIKVLAVFPHNNGGNRLADVLTAAGVNVVRIVADRFQTSLTYAADGESHTLRNKAIRRITDRVNTPSAREGGAKEELQKLIERIRDYQERKDMPDEDMRAVEELLRAEEEKVLQTTNVYIVTPANAVVNRIRDQNFHLVTCDEAAALNEPVTASIIAKGIARVVLVGDTNQCRPWDVTTHPKVADHMCPNSQVLLPLSASTFERLQRMQCPGVQLRDQYRMREELFKYAQKEVYEETIDCRLTASALATLFTSTFFSSKRRAVHFVQLNRSTTDKAKEQAIVAANLAVIMHEGDRIPEADIVVLSPTFATSLVVKRYLSARNVAGVRSMTVGAAKGGEWQIVILCMGVRDGKEFDDKMFLNLATTRQRSELFFVGDWYTVAAFSNKHHLRRYYDIFSESDDKDDSCQLTEAEVSEQHQRVRESHECLWIRFEHCNDGNVYPTKLDFVRDFYTKLDCVPPNGTGIYEVREGCVGIDRTYWLHVEQKWKDWVFSGSKWNRKAPDNYRLDDKKVLCAKTFAQAKHNMRTRAVMDVIDDLRRKYKNRLEADYLRNENDTSRMTIANEFGRQTLSFTDEYTSKSSQTLLHYFRNVDQQDRARLHEAATRAYKEQTKFVAGPVTATKPAEDDDGEARPKDRAGPSHAPF